MITRRGATAAIGVLIIIGAFLFIYDWFYSRYIWPSEIQSQLFGKRLVSNESMIEFSSHTSYGQGISRWRYSVDLKNPVIAEMCGNSALLDCSFRKTRRVSDDVVQVVQYSAGVLTVEEIWS